MAVRSLLLRHQVEAAHRQPYILGGYRQTDTSFSQCLRYSLVLHNDVINFWTHFLPLFPWMVWFYALVSYHDLDLSHPYSYPLLCSWIGSCSYALCSSIAHLLSSKSLLVHKVCFMLDYLGIAMFSLGVNFGALFYLSTSTSPCFSYTNVVIAIEISLALFATIIGSLSDVFWSDYRYAIRIGAYMLPYACYIAPFLHRQCVCWLYGTDCVPETMHLHVLSMLTCAMGGFFYISMVPERFMPGRFDIFFQSHQLFHVCCVVNSCLQIHFFTVEMLLRGETLRQVDGAIPTWETTLLPFVCTGIFGLCVVTVLGVLTWKGVLVTNKNIKNE